MKLDVELAELKSQLNLSLPKCGAHPDRFAIAFCGHCGQPVCQACLTVIPVEPRCAKCQPLADRLPSRGAWLAGFLRGLTRQRWAASFMAAAIVFAVILLFLPGLFRARPPSPAIPGILGKTPLQAPYIEKAFRLRTAGDLYAARNLPDRARDRYRKALAACHTHLEGEKRAHVRLQVELAIAKLQLKAGDPAGAMETCRKVISGSAGSPAAGVAHYYLGQIYEVGFKDPAKALANYRIALQHAQSSRGDPLRNIEKLVEYDDDKGAGGKTIYAIAGLTDTQTSAGALHGEIVESIQRITGEKQEGSGDSPVPDEEPPRAEENDPLVIMRGR